MTKFRPKFRVEIAGSFYTYELYDAKGREIHNCREAAEFAESEYGCDWQLVYGGDEAMDRAEYLHVNVEPEELESNGYDAIVHQDGEGAVYIRNVTGGVEVFAVRDDYADWSLDTTDGRCLEFCRTADSDEVAGIENFLK
jgi:hypothetical protein